MGERRANAICVDYRNCLGDIEMPIMYFALTPIYGSIRGLGRCGLAANRALAMDGISQPSYRADDPCDPTGSNKSNKH